MSKAGTGAVPGCWVSQVGFRHPRPPYKRGGQVSHSIPTVPNPMNHPFSVASEIIRGRKTQKADLDIRRGYVGCVGVSSERGEETKPGSCEIPLDNGLCWPQRDLVTCSARHPSWAQEGHGASRVRV